MMKPPLNEHALPIPGCVNQPQAVSEFANIPGTVSTLKTVQDHYIPGSVSTHESPKTPQKF